MEERVFYNDCFISLGYEDSEKCILFIVLKGAFDVYLDGKIVQARDIKFANKTWGYSRLLNPRTFLIYDTYSEAEYARILIKAEETEIQLNEFGLSGWLTINKLKPNINLTTSIRLYFQSLKCSLGEEKYNDCEIEHFIMKNALIICDSITILNRKMIFNIAKDIIFNKVK